MGNSTSERERKEAEFGDKIYEIVQEIYPESCENITGMLLEAKYDELERLLTTTGREELEARIHEAAKNLFATSNLISERAKNEQTKNIDDGNLNNTKPYTLHIAQMFVKELPNNDKNNMSEKSGNSTDQSRTLEKKQALGEKIYSLIKNQHPNDAEVLTGILLEMDVKSLEQLIKDTDLLEQKMDKVLAVLQNTSGQSQNGQSEFVLKEHCDIGEQLYELVSAFNSEQADKITGMLLEMDVKDLEVIVKNQAVLEEKINQALTVLNSHHKQPETPSLADKEPDKTQHGEQLYRLISEWYPDLANKITGMLLELDVATLNLLLEDSVALRDKASHAASTLNKRNAEKVIPPMPDALAASQEMESKRMLESETRHSLTKQLYSIIKEWYPDEAGKLTEMLIDSGKDSATLETLVLNRQLLKENIERVLDVEQRTAKTVPKSESNKNGEGITTDELGGKLFEMVEELCPKNADKITGMLLEMSVTNIENIVKNPQELEEKIHLAEKALV